MPKVIPECPPLPPAKPVGEERTYRIELITPLFGGGVEASENDPTMPIRGTSIRGQLQFWWRATRGAAFATVDEMRSRHRAVWGTTDLASPVVVEVEDVKAGDPVACGAIEWNQRARGGQGAWRLNWRDPFRQHEHLPYVLFPFQGKLPRNDPRAMTEEHPAKCVCTAAFTLRIRSRTAEILDEVSSAVWAWVNFGGIGARTRRGCGALFCKDLAPVDLKSLETWFRVGAGKPGVKRDWPVLGDRLLSRRTTSSTFEAWNHVIGLIKQFRQGRDVGRNPGESENRPGRSRFPEPDTIRRILDTHADLHEPQDWMPDGFPRAEFGLPIVFHFKDDRNGDPPETYLYPYVGEDTKDRMASPLILKPLALQDRSAVSVIVPLLGADVNRVELQDERRNCLNPLHAVPVRSPVFATYHESPLQGRSTAGSALEGFLAFVREAPMSFVETFR